MVWGRVRVAPAKTQSDGYRVVDWSGRVHIGASDGGAKSADVASLSPKTIKAILSPRLRYHISVIA